MLLQITNYIYGLKPLKNVKNNAVLFKLFWHKVFLKLPNFMTDSLLNPATAPDFSDSVFHSSSIGGTGYSGFMRRILIRVRRNKLTSLTS